MSISEWYERYLERSDSPADKRIRRSSKGEPSTPSKIISVLNRPPYVFSTVGVAIRAQIPTRTALYGLHELIVAHRVQSVRIPEPQGGWSYYWCVTPFRNTVNGSLRHCAMITAIMDFVRIRTFLGGTFHDSLAQTFPSGPDLSVITENRFERRPLVTIEVELGSKACWRSAKYARAEMQKMLDRAVGFQGVWVIVPSGKVKLRIERLVGRIERVTLITIRQFGIRVNDLYAKEVVARAMSPLTEDPNRLRDVILT